MTKSFARIHAANLVNAGIIPFNFVNEADYDRIDAYDELELPNVREAIKKGENARMINKTKNETYELTYDLSARQREMILAGGLLNYTRENGKG